MKAKAKKINGHTLPQFIAFLNETLIPDLKKSGTTETAKDFESAVQWIEFVGDQHGAALAMLKKLRDAAINTPVLDSSKDWTHLIAEADRVLGARPIHPVPATRRNIGGSILPSSSPEILKPIDCSLGRLQVRALPGTDTHALFLTTSQGETLLASHPNGYSCHSLAKRMAAKEWDRAREQAYYIVQCGGTAPNVLQVIAGLKQPKP